MHVWMKGIQGFTNKDHSILKNRIMRVFSQINIVIYYNYVLLSQVSDVTHGPLAFHFLVVKKLLFIHSIVLLGLRNHAKSRYLSGSKVFKQAFLVVHLHVIDFQEYPV